MVRCVRCGKLFPETEIIMAFGHTPTCDVCFIEIISSEDPDELDVATIA